MRKRAIPFLRVLPLIAAVIGVVVFVFPQRADAAAPSFVACGGVAAGMAAITPALPTGLAEDDILLLFLETGAQAISVANGNGGTWAAVANSPQTAGTTTALTVFWSRYNGTQGNPTTSDSGDHQVGVICAYRGAESTGDPWDVTSGGVDTNVTTTGTIPGATTTGPDRLVVIVGSGDDDLDTPITAVTNADLASISAERVNAETAAGNDGGLTVFDGGKTSAGTYGNTTLTYTGATTKGMMTIALKPRITTIADGVDPSNASISPGASATDLDAFTLQTSSGTDTVTAATVTLASGTSGGLSLVAITSNDSSTTYCSVSNPASDTVSLTGCTIPVTTTATTFKVRITPKSHANMPAPPGSTYTVTGTVTAFTSTNTQSGTDTDSATVTIDNASPANVTSASGTAGNAQVALSWTNPADSDFHSTVVLRRAASAVTDTPTEGTTYTAGNIVGSSTVACVVATPTASCTDTGLTNGTAYHYKIFSRDSNANYATGAVPTGSPFTPAAAPVTTIADGIDPSNASLAPGASATDLDAFTLQTNTGTDTVTAATVTLAAGVSGGLSLVAITNSAGTTTYCSQADPASSTVSLTGCTVPVTTTATTFKVRITPKSHANMPAPPGSTYTVTGTVTAFTSTNTQSGTDTDSATITIDNTSPANVTSASGTAGNAQVSLSWTNPADSDFHSTVVLRRAGAATSDTPTEGTTYTVGNAVGSSTVACVVSTPTASCTDTGLTNGTAYHYRIYTRDTDGNYSATGVVPTGSPFTPAATTTIGDGADPPNASIAPGASATDLDAFTLQTNAGTDTVTAATVTLAAGVSGGLSLVAITNSAGTTTYCSQADPASSTVSLTGCTIPVTTTATTFKVRITPKSHANMPAPPGSTYTVTGTVTTFTGTNTQSGTDTDSATITIDNASPANVTSASGTAGNAQVALSWTNPTDSDFHSTVVLRRELSAVTDTPTEGTTYTVGNTVGSSTVACVVAAPSNSCSDTGLTNGTAYHYRIYTRDSNGNYSATGVVPTGSPLTPAVPLDTTAPAAVSDLALSNPTVSSVTITWTAPGDDGSTGTATTYDIRFSTATITEANWANATQVTGEPAPAVAGTVQTTTASTLSANTTYFFAMKTRDEALNESALSNVATTTTLADSTAPAAVSNLAAANPTTTTADLTWTAPGDDGSTGTATSYDLRYSTSTITESNFASATQVTGEPTPSAAGAAEAMTVTGLTAGTTYFFSIKTSDEVPNASAISNVPSASTVAPPDTTAPAAVTNLALSDASNSAMTVSWTAPGDDGSTGTATTYDLRYSTSAITADNFSAATQVTGEPTPSVAGSLESKVVSGLTASTTHFFALKTSDEVPNTSAISNVPSTATTATPDTTAPAAVTSLALSNPSSSSMVVSWTAPGDDGTSGTATVYDLRYSTSAVTASNFASATQAAGEPTPSVAGATESLTVTGLTASTTYSFALKTSDEVPNTSAISNVPSAATTAESASPPPSSPPPSPPPPSSPPPTPSPAPTGGGSGGVVNRATLSGRAYPNSTIEATKRSTAEATPAQTPPEVVRANPDGTFSVSYAGLTNGDYLFVLRARDVDGRDAGAVTFNASFFGNTFEVKDVLMPPTIGFRKSSVAKNEVAGVVGYATSNSVIELTVDGVKYRETKANAAGLWSVEVEATYLSYGEHYVRAKQVLPDGKTSSFSITRAFRISKLPVSQADLNDDFVVDIRDWSIFLFRWDSADASLRSKNDFNNDGKINVFDLSIFLQAMKT